MTLIINDDDKIRIDLDKKTIDVLISEEEIDTRKSNLKINLKEAPYGALRKYRDTILRN